MSEQERFEGLARALAALHRKRAGKPSRDWDLVADAVGYTVRRIAPRALVGELVSEVFLKVCCASSPFVAESDRAAHAYLSTTTRHALIDHGRRQTRARWRLPGRHEGDDDGFDPLERIAAAEPDPMLEAEAMARLDETKDRLRGYLDLVLEEAELRPADRELRHHQAECCVMTVLEKQSASAIREALGVSPSDAALYKWTERGRPWVLRALERWAQGSLPPDDAAAVGFLRELFSARRADAGAARPTRRAAGPKTSGKKASKSCAAGRSVSRNDTGASVQHPRPRRRSGPRHGGSP